MQDLLNTFGLEWPKFLAQLILFIIVYFVLKKFAFGPIIAMLEERRKLIEEGQLNAQKIKKQLAEAEQRHAEILAQANLEAQKLIDKGRESASLVADKKMQEAVASAEQMIAKAREASALEYERSMDQLKRELGHLVVETTAKVTGKVLTADDQKRLQEEAARQLAS
jgi:F-type H+-transporting ATPase subunit b